MNQIEIQNFRCFLKPGPLALRPLTFLVGENSTGKSSFLAAVRLAWGLGNAVPPLDFNEEPFLLGAFDQIAHFRGGRAGRAQSFELGFSESKRILAQRRSKKSRSRLPARPLVWHRARFERAGSHPAIVQQTIESGDYRLKVTLPPGDKLAQVSVQIAGDTRLSFEIDDPYIRVRDDSQIDWTFVQYLLATRKRGGRGKA